MSAANAALGGDPSARIVSVQSGADVVIFADSDGDHMADMAVALVNVSLLSIDATNFI